MLVFQHEMASNIDTVVRTIGGILICVCMCVCVVFMYIYACVGIYAVCVYCCV